VAIVLERPKPSKGPSPTLTTVHRIENILRDAAAKGEAPLSYAEIARRLPAAKTRPDTVKAAVRELQRFGLVAEGSKGVMWVLASDELWNRPSVPLE
jgi:hypothetical protein